MIARVGRRITGFAYARLRELDRVATHDSDAGRPARATRPGPHPRGTGDEARR
jgi:hypothetical protein